MKKAVIARRFSQAFFLILFVYILWSTTYPLAGLLPPGTFFNIDPLLMIMTSLSSRVILPGFVVALGMLVLTLILGRFFCGWICPLGTSIDAVNLLRKQSSRKLSDAQNRVLSLPKFLILAAVGIAALLGRQIAWIFDPVVLMARFISLNLIPAVTASLNTFFIFLIRDLKFEGAVRDLYRSLKPTLLGVKTDFFSNAGVILAYFLAVVAVSLVISRFWCRSLCPLGALYALAGRFAPFRRVIDRCIKCQQCSNECRTGAIKKDLSYIRGECILCMDCIYTCPEQGIRFGFRGGASEPPSVAADDEPKGGISRKQFLVLLASSFAILGFRRTEGKSAAAVASGGGADIIRPPAALTENEFTDRCVRCGNCMKVCITNGLQPVMLETGYSGIWTPRLVPEIGYCEYQCTLCGRTCPTGAIPPLNLEQKLKIRLGTAEVDRSICLPWAEGKECIVCQEHCPVPEKAIILDREGPVGLGRPRISEELCVGCGICQNKCPVRPRRAIRVSPTGADRT